MDQQDLKVGLVPRDVAVEIPQGVLWNLQMALEQMDLLLTAPGVGEGLPHLVELLRRLQAAREGLAVC